MATAPLPWVASIALSLGIGVGVLALARWSLRAADLQADDRTVAATLGFVGWPVLIRRLTAERGAMVPPEIAGGLVLEAICVAVGLAALGVSGIAHRRLGRGPEAPVLTGLLGWGGLVAMAVALVVLVGPLERGTALVLAITVAVVGLGLAIQRVVAGRGSRRAVVAMGTLPALVVAGAQLLDGVVSYLAVVDPLDLVAGRFQEEVLVSAKLLEVAGPGYPLAKWIVALAFVYFLEEEQVPGTTGVPRLAAYLVVTLLGLGPGLFSATQVLTA